jgi:hyperosmotically inducible protein
MQKAAPHTIRAVVMTAAAVLVLGACTREERKEVRTEAKQATTAVANVVDNAALTTKVKAALLADELVKGTQINVDSDNGVVTLKGTVDSPTHMQRAEQLAKGVSGVTRVQNNLTVATATTTPPSTMATTPSTTPPPSSMTADKKGTATTKP